LLSNRALVTIFSFLRKTVKAKFPDDEFVEFTSVSGFIFLRLFCPAILGPTLFGIWNGFSPFLSFRPFFLSYFFQALGNNQNFSEDIPKEEARALTLIAKTIQNIGNLAEFGYKEPYMKDANPFIVERFEKLKSYIRAISV